MTEKHSSDLLDENLKENFWDNKLHFNVSDEKHSSDFTPNNHKPKSKPKMYKMERNSVLDKVKLFLPELENANETTSMTKPEERNIENIKDCSNVIEMDLAFVEDLEKTPLGKLLNNLSSDDSSDSDEEDL